MNNIAHLQFHVRIVVQNDRPRNGHVMNTRETLFISAMWLQVICLPDLFPQSTQECQAVLIQVLHRSEPRNPKKPEGPLQTPFKCHVVWQNWHRSLIQHLNENMGCWPVCIKGDWPTRTFVIVQELCESRGGHPGLSVLTSLLVSVDVKICCTVLRHWSQLVPNMSHDIWGH